MNIGNRFAQLTDHSLGAGKEPATLGTHNTIKYAQKQNGNHRYRSGDHRPGDSKKRFGMFYQHQRTQSHGYDTANGQHAVGHHFHLEDKEYQSQKDKQHADIVNRQSLKRKKRQQQSDGAKGTGQNDTRLGYFEKDTEHAQHQQHVSDVRVADNIEYLLSPTHFGE